MRASGSGERNKINKTRRERRTRRGGGEGEEEGGRLTCGKDLRVREQQELSLSATICERRGAGGCGGEVSAVRHHGAGRREEQEEYGARESDDDGNTQLERRERGQ